MFCRGGGGFVVVNFLFVCLFVVRFLIGFCFVFYCF